MKRLTGRLALLVLPLGLALQACASGAPPAGASIAAAPGRVSVVAAENVWGSIAAQLGGDRASVTSIIANPDTDPHDYEATPADARAIASAKYVILNGAGYDAWAGKLVSADPVKGRLVLNVAGLVGVKEGGNPHVWYSPPDVLKTIDQITADY